MNRTLLFRLIFLFSFIISPLFLKAQFLQRSDINPFFEHNEESVKRIYIPYEGKYQLVIDTINVCQTRENRIKKVWIYEFSENKEWIQRLSDNSDSLLQSKIEYNEEGLITKWDVGKKGWYSDNMIELKPLNIDCNSLLDSLNQIRLSKRNSTKKIINVHRNEKGICQFDSLGYLIEYVGLELGFFNRLFRTISGMGSVSRKYKYTYNPDYTSVIIEFCYSDNFKKCKELSNDYTEVNFDKDGNLFSYFWYERLENGERHLIGGEKYYYEFYEIDDLQH